MALSQAGRADMWTSQNEAAIVRVDTRPIPVIGAPALPRARSRRALVAWALAALTTMALVLAVDDVRIRWTQPHESIASHRYMDGAVRQDPGAMWDAYSARARAVRGGDRGAYIVFMNAGTHPQAGEPNAYRLVAHVPLDDGYALIYYQIDVATASGGQHVLFPVVIDAQGLVDDAASDGVSFVPPRPPTAMS